MDKSHQQYRELMNFHRPLISNVIRLSHRERKTCVCHLRRNSQSNTAYAKTCGLRGGEKSSYHTEAHNIAIPKVCF